VPFIQCAPLLCISIWLNDQRFTPRRCHPQPFSLSIHSRIYEGQFSNFTPSAWQCSKKQITSRSTTPTFFRFKTILRESGWSSKSLFSSAIACVSSRPLKMNTVNLPRATVSILKVIGSGHFANSANEHPSSGRTTLRSFRLRTDHQ